LSARHGRHALDALENDLRTHRAVETDDVRIPAVQRTRDVLGRGAVRRVMISADRHLRDDGHRLIHLARRTDRLLDLVKIAEGLEEKEVDAAGREGFHLLAERGACVLNARESVRLEANAEWTDRA